MGRRTRPCPPLCISAVPRSFLLQLCFIFVHPRHSDSLPAALIQFPRLFQLSARVLRPARRPFPCPHSSYTTLCRAQTRSLRRLIPKHRAVAQVNPVSPCSCIQKLQHSGSTTARFHQRSENMARHNLRIFPSPAALSSAARKCTVLRLHQHLGMLFHDPTPSPLRPNITLCPTSALGVAPRWLQQCHVTYRLRTVYSLQYPDPHRSPASLIISHTPCSSHSRRFIQHPTLTGVRVTQPAFRPLSLHP